MTLTLDQIRAAPKVLLHDHLDGGLRPVTIIELAQAIGYDELPSYDPEELARSMTGAARRGHLERYLEPFRHTVAVMQTPEALTRVAAECAEDLAADGVVYAEVRFAPELHLDARAARWTRWSRPCWRASGGGSAGPRHRGPGPAHRDADRGPVAGYRRAGRALPRPGRGRLRHRRGRGGLAADPPPGQLRVRAAGKLPRHHPRRRGASGCRRSGRRSSAAAPSGLATASVSSTTSRPTRTVRLRWAGWPRSSGTAGSRSSCARPPTSRPVPPRPSPSTRSACSGS